MGPWPWLPPRSKPHLALTLMLRLTPGTATTATDHIGAATTATDMATMATTERGLLMPSPLMPLPQAPTLMLRLTLGTDTTGTGTDLMAMGTMATDLMVMLTGDKKWTSRTTSDLFLPTHL